MADQSGIPPAPTAPPPPDGDTFPMVFGDGSRAMVPSARVNDAYKAGGKLAQPMKMRDGSMSLVPFDEVHDQMAQGATFMPSSAAGTIPKPQPPQMREVDPTVGTGAGGAVLRAGQGILGAPKQTVQAFTQPPQNDEEAAVAAAAPQFGTGKLALAAKRLLFDPQRETYQQGQAMEDLANQNPAGPRHEAALRDTAGALKMASLVPLVGPLAAHLAMTYQGDPSSSTANEQNPYGTEGDPTGALTEGLAYAAEPGLTEKLGGLQGTGQAAFLDAPEEAEALRVSTRNPTAPGRTEDPLAQDLQINRQAIRDSPPGKGDVPVEDKMADRVSDYTGQKLTGTPAQRLNAFQKHVADNLVWLHNQLPEDFRARAKLWYDSANKLAADWGEKYNLSTQQVAGIIASLSPQKDWNMNVSLARRMIEGFQQHQDTPYSAAMEATSKDLASTASLRPYLDAIRGKTLSELTDPYEKAMWIRLHDEAENPQSYEIYAPEGGTTGLARNQLTNAQIRKGQTLGDPSKLIWHSNPNLAKALSIIEDGSRENISDQLGDMHKVRNFYNNIIAPNSKAGDVTIDTHAVAAGLLRPLAGIDPEVKHNFGGSLAPGKNPMYPDGVPGSGGSKVTGVNGTYGLYADAYRAAAQKLGLLPRELQSITWEGVRSLFPSEYKKIEANKAIIDGIWSDYANGKIPTINQARKAVVKAAGDFKPAEWETPVGGVNEAIPTAGIDETTRSAARPQDISGGGVYGPSPGATRAGGGSRTPAGISGGVPRKVAAPSPVPPPLKRVARK